MQNLSVIAKEISELEEEKQLLLREYFDISTFSSLPFATAASRLRSAYWARRKEDKSSLRSETVKEKIFVASLLAENYTIDDIINSEEDIRSIGTKAKIAYWASNRYSRLAYNRFSSLSEAAEHIAAESFSDVCELVSDGDSDFGILPIENSTDGRLVGFYRMLDKYDLKICAVCNIEDDTGEHFTRFALISRTLCRFDNTRSRSIELSATSSNATQILEIIAIAEHWGMPVKRLSSVPLYYRGNACIDTVTLALSDKTAASFFIYLYLFGKDINILGVFIQI